LLSRQIGYRTRVPSTAAASPPRSARLAVSLFFFLNGALFASWVARIPAVQETLRMSHARLGVALLAGSAGALLAMPFTGWSVARYGSRLALRIAAVLFCFGLPWLAVAPSPAWLTLVLFLYGALYGAMDVSMNAQAIAVEERYGRPIMSFFHALFSVGGLAGAAAGSALAAAGIPPLIHFTAAAGVLGLLCVGLGWPRLLEAGEEKSHHAPEGAPLTTWQRPPARLVALGFLAFCIMMGEGSMADWSAIYLREQGADEGTAAAGFAAFSIAMAVMRFAGDRLSAGLGAERLVHLGGAIAAAGLAIALSLGGAVPAFLGFLAAGVGFSTIVPQVFSAAGRVPGLSSGPAIATATTIGYTGFLLGPPLIGFAADTLHSLRAALGIIVVVSLIAIALGRSVRPERREGEGPAD
jgi:MFS family permease